MKLRNKKTGEIREIKEILIDGMFTITSLAELNDEWEDVPDEPDDKIYYYINDLGNVDCSTAEVDSLMGSPNNSLIRKALGNYFETREKTEQAIEKLRAWKRLKDLGLKFELRNMGREVIIEPVDDTGRLTMDDAQEAFNLTKTIFGEVKHGRRKH